MDVVILVYSTIFVPFRLHTDTFKPHTHIYTNAHTHSYTHHTHTLLQTHTHTLLHTPHTQAENPLH